MSDALAEVTSWVFADMADPREFLPIAKMNPAGPELHSPGSGGSAPTPAARKKERRLAATGLGATGVATIGGLHAVSATVKENRGRMAATRGLRRARHTPAARLARAAHITPGRAAALVGAGWLGLHGVELTGDALAMRAQTRALHENAKKNRATKATTAEPVQKVLGMGQLRRVGSGLRTAADLPGHLRAVRSLPATGQAARANQLAAHDAQLAAHMSAQRAEVAKPMERFPGETRPQRNLREKQQMGQANRAKAKADVAETLAHPQVQSAAATVLEGVKQAQAPAAKKALIRHPAVLVGGGALGGAGALSYSNNRRRPISARAPQQVVDELTYTGQISKLDADKKLAFGWASISKVNGEPYVDRQGDWIPIEVTEQAAYDYVRSSRVGGDMHRRAGITKEFGPHKVADLVESFVVTPEKLQKMGMPPDAVPEGWWIGMKVHDEETWDAIKSGKRTGFSVHGTGIRKDVTL